MTRPWKGVAVTQKRAVRRKRVSGLSRGKIWVGAAIAVLVILGAAFGLRQQGVLGPSGSTLTAEQTSFDLGRVSMTGGLIRTRFALAVQGNPLVTTLVTN